MLAGHGELRLLLGEHHCAVIDRINIASQAPALPS